MSAQEYFAGKVLIAIPHMDDGVLGCGATLARLASHADITAVYATDGARSPVPPWPLRDPAVADLPAIRRAEACAALDLLGIPSGNIHFLNLPDSHLREHEDSLGRLLDDLVSAVQPDFVFVPFRYDRHPDHLALNRIITDRVARQRYSAALYEYFVYHRWKLLPGGDVRSYIEPDLLLSFDTSSVANQKRRALDCFASQTTRYFAWQTRPNLTPALLDEVSQSPELFLRYEPQKPGTTIFTRARWWIPVAHVLEPQLKKRKDQAVAIIKRGLHG